MRIGDRFGRYEIVGTLGSGGMGAVYRALDTRLGRWVALKIVEARDDGMAQVLHEARAAASIEHPNAVAIFDVDAVDGLPFLAMEIVEGKTLRTWVTDGDASLDDRIRWLAEVASALAAAHRRGVIHRDVKPENVIVRSDGVVKVVDFGIARALPEVDRAAVTQSMQLASAGGPEVRVAGAMTWGVRGTPAYMAPEQLRGEPLDARADQFAWGLVAFEVLTGEHAWPRRTVVDLVRCIALEDAPRAGVGPAVDAVIARTLAKRRTDRFASMDEAAQAFLTAFESDLQRESGESRLTLMRVVFAVCAALLLVAAFDSSRAVAPRRARPPVVTRALSASPAALARYRQGLDLLREGSRAAAVKAFEEASTIDPELAAAHLRAAMYVETPDTSTRTHLQRASQARSALTDRERAFLRAYEPWTRVPGDWAEAVRRWEELTRANPEDSEAWVALGRARRDIEDNVGAVVAYERALALEPSLAIAWEGKGRAHLYAGEDARARAAFERCLDVAPASQPCLWMMAGFLRAAGQCRDEEPLALRLIALEPMKLANYEVLANARYGVTGDARDARAPLELGLSRLSGGARESVELPAQTRLAVLAGDFASAEKFARQWSESVASSPEEEAYIAPYWYRIAIAIETGQKREATAIAREYLAKRIGWMRNEEGGGRSINIIRLLYRGGAIDHIEMRRMRREWIEGAHGARPKAFLWIDAYAGMAMTAEDAEEAMEMLPNVGPLPTPTNGGLDFEIEIGEVFRLASRYDEALMHLRAAVMACESAHYPFLHIWAVSRLAQAFESTGARDDACRAYGAVLSSWGAAVKSRTAMAALTARRRLRCP